MKNKIKNINKIFDLLFVIEGHDQMKATYKNNVSWPKTIPWNKLDYLNGS